MRRRIIETNYSEKGEDTTLIVDSSRSRALLTDFFLSELDELMLRWSS